MLDHGAWCTPNLDKRHRNLEATRLNIAQDLYPFPWDAKITNVDVETLVYPN